MKQTIEYIGLVELDCGIQTPLKCKTELHFTGKRHFIIKGKDKVYLSNSLAEGYKNQGKQIHSEDGIWWEYRSAIETITATGKKDWWYLNTPSDGRIIKASKYGLKRYKEVVNSKPNILKDKC